MTERPLNGSELRDYWRTLHSFAGEVNERDDPEFLAIVCYAGAPRRLNAFVAKTQQRAFQRAVAACGSLEGSSVLEIGCGRGRWSRLLRDAGAGVLAIDVSSAAIESNRRHIPGVTFAEGDIVDLDFPDESFDLALSVTVLQHLLPEEQERAAAEIARLVRPGGHFLLMENIRDRDQHVFGRTIEGWTKLFRRNGLVLVSRNGYSYDLPLRFLGRMRSVVRRRPAPTGGMSANGAELAAGVFRRPVSRGRRVYRQAILSPTVVAARLLEPASAALLPDARASHCAFLFERRR